jgi:adenosylcobyric acid synthase
MFQSVASGAGKSTLTAVMCRLLFKEGIRVAPFKAQNLSLNSFVTRDGGEIGMAQAFQAWAAGIEPEKDMNPVLIKPKGGGRAQLIVDGGPIGDVGFGLKGSVERATTAVEKAYRALTGRFDALIIEGAGSPVEINLEGRDIANMHTADMADAPVVLIGDIEMGGVFAGIYGTYLLLPERHRERIKGFVINRTRGNTTVLAEGIAILEERMGIPCLGLLPYVPTRLPEEDSLGMGSAEGRPAGIDMRVAWLRSLDEFIESVGSERMKRIVEVMQFSV